MLFPWNERLMIGSQQRLAASLHSASISRLSPALQNFWLLSQAATALCRAQLPQNHFSRL